MTNYEEKLIESYRERLAYVDAHKTKLVEAWVAETGLLPSESVLVVQETRDGTTVTVKYWVERRKTDAV